MLIEGALIALAGVTLGRLLPDRRRPPTPRTEPRPGPRPHPEPVCGCTHHYALHDPVSKACHGTVQIPRFNVFGNQAGFKFPACACCQYVGPVPMPEYYAPEIGA